MYKVIALVLVIFALGGGAVAVHWLWTRIVLVFVCCAVGLFWITRPRRR